ncbi:MAG TPA: nuclear transport factor 2 family protein [Puia sp.]|jgi:hypothetical protein
MTIQEVAAKLVEFCRKGEFEAAQKQLYTDNASSNEPANSPGMASVTGLDQIIAKGHQFQAMLEAVHSISVSDPVIAGEYFSISLHMDVTMKGMGRQPMDEIAIYHVKDGKVLSEQFFYNVM